MQILNNAQMNLLENSLDAASMRQKVISNNIANVDTPYFKKSVVRFEDLLQKEMNSSSSRFVGYRTNVRHFTIGAAEQEIQPTVEEQPLSVMNNNRNNVDIDYEMSLMAKNQLRYNTFVEQMNYEVRQMRTAINGGK